MIHHNRPLAFSMTMFLTLLFCCFLFGCAHKAIVQETSEGQNVNARKQVAAETDAEKAAREKALRESAIREEERQRVAREKTQRDMKVAKATALANMQYIYFDFDKSQLTAASRDTLKKIADKLNTLHEFNLSIEGNADERGTVEYNLALGEKRANAAKAYLVSLGIDKGKISTISYGKEKPVDPGHTEEAWSKNRNDHFVVSAKK